MARNIIAAPPSPYGEHNTRKSTRPPPHHRRAHPPSPPEASAKPMRHSSATKATGQQPLPPSSTTTTWLPRRHHHVPACCGGHRQQHLDSREEEKKQRQGPGALHREQPSSSRCQQQQWQREYLVPLSVIEDSRLRDKLNSFVEEKLNSFVGEKEQQQLGEEKQQLGRLSQLNANRRKVAGPLVLRPPRRLPLLPSAFLMVDPIFGAPAQDRLLLPILELSTASMEYQRLPFLGVYHPTVDPIVAPAQDRPLLPILELSTYQGASLEYQPLPFLGVYHPTVDQVRLLPPIPELSTYEDEPPKTDQVQQGASVEYVHGPVPLEQITSQGRGHEDPVPSVARPSVNKCDQGDVVDPVSCPGIVFDPGDAIAARLATAAEKRAEMEKEIHKAIRDACIAECERLEAKRNRHRQV
ncbi:hypothetical protein SELMODRAFT_403600 [Selaginella moellendorffii]|uniref:Uncharacterized protein n=1 Tax=Selaginella moellendorffii TaxID=88036 RepID=D8QRX5_SELML|nr:hypothetical protein SELMODRAFT_403600 [Selaginella moellendorffii]